MPGTSLNKVMMDLVKEFDITQKKLPAEKTVIKIRLYETRSLIMISQLHGEVTLLSTKTLQKIC